MAGWSRPIPESNIDAAVHVAHAITVHEAQKELDYFTVVDDLKHNDEDAGAAGIFDAELTSGLYYGYAVVDVPALISNLSGVAAKDWNKADVSRELAGEVTARLTHLIATVSPGAKKGSTAPYAYAETVLVEAGNRQPRTLANAFRKPVPLRGDIEEGALRAMRDHIKGFERAYGPGEARAALHANGQASLVEDVAGPLKSLPELSEWVKKAIVAAQV